ncbi:MAG: dihydroorotase [Hyphomicrobiales bacterium]|nr:MAG: dihydroorotase [Hyphomicrobiales bacterium]
MSKHKIFYNARLIDPVEMTDSTGGMYIGDGKVLDIGSHVTRDYDAKIAVEYIDVKGQILAPGLVDMRVFMNGVGNQTLKNTGVSAAAGGVTSLMSMPNSEPIIEDIALVEYINGRSKSVSGINLYTSAALTQGLEGKQMAEIGLLKKAGAIAFTDGRKSVQNSLLFKRLLEYAKSHNALIIHDVEDKDLAGDGVMNEGLFASRLGLPSKPKIAETILLERDLALASLTKAKYHVSQISCAESLNAVIRAKSENAPITAGVSINNLTLNEFDIGEYRSFLRLEPPLRSEDDRMAMVEGIKNGDIDVIVSSHDPQDPDGKRHPFADAAVGAVGLETLLSAALRLYHSEGVDLPTLWRALSYNPAQILGLNVGYLKTNSPADFIIVDAEHSWKVERTALKSQSTNTPFENRILQGKVLATYIDGHKIFELGN